MEEKIMSIFTKLIIYYIILILTQDCMALLLLSRVLHSTNAQLP